MADSATAETGGSAGDSNDARDADPLSELRRLLVGTERRQLTELRTRIDDPEVRAKDVGNVLAEAIRLHTHDRQLASALAPSVEDAITTSVRRNPHPLADALFPVMGPAIRKAISHTLAAMVESLNRTLEHSLSWEALTWRWTAFRTGKSFAEIVLLNTLVYRVEQVFLIDRTSGLLLQHVTEGGDESKDADMVSGMLTAIRDFVRDSFKVEEHHGLDALRVGDLSVWIEQGPHAVLAAVIRGTAPLDLRLRFQDALDTVHVQFSAELEAFKGDTAPFEPARPILEACLQTQYKSKPSKRASTLKYVGAALLALLLVWLALSVRDRRRWNTYLDSLRAEPGIVVVQSSRGGGRYSVSGLRDPLARDPATLIQQAGIAPDRVNARWDLYQALDPPLVLARARAMLAPPDGVRLTLNAGVLAASGTAPAGWIERSRQLAVVIPGVSRLDLEALHNADLDALTNSFHAISLGFVRGTTDLVPSDAPIVAEVIGLARRLNDLALARGERARLEVIGHTDSDGEPAANLPLSRARAERIAAMLSRSELDYVDVVVTGLGSNSPVSGGQTETDKQRNRRVSFRVAGDENAPGRIRP